jgi:hypothetical protein
MFRCQAQGQCACARYPRDDPGRRGPRTAGRFLCRPVASALALGLYMRQRRLSWPGRPWSGHFYPAWRGKVPQNVSLTPTCRGHRTAARRMEPTSGNGPASPVCSDRPCEPRPRRRTGSKVQ